MVHPTAATSIETSYYLYRVAGRSKKVVGRK
jgi:hypothetical protein